MGRIIFLLLNEHGNRVPYYFSSDLLIDLEAKQGTHIMISDFKRLKQDFPEVLGVVEKYYVETLKDDDVIVYNIPERAGNDVQR